MNNKHAWQHQAPVVMLLLALLVALAACSGSTQSDVASRDGAANSTTINVVADDFSYSIDATQAVEGKIAFVVVNKGSMPHDFSISGNGVEQKTQMIAPGESSTLEVDLAPGTYTYICTVPGHSMLGMQGTFTVKSGS
jgi:uncharacterized cupredoxin-like copper-binding protein